MSVFYLLPLCCAVLLAAGAVHPGTFDRVLADVPCSGDGTLRKSPTQLEKWSVKGGLQLHSTQFNIAKRGLMHLKAGGFMVYSTCSMNPIENEAVVAALLASCVPCVGCRVCRIEFCSVAHGFTTIVYALSRNKGKLELMETKHLLPGLIRRPGLSTWVVMDDAEVVYTEVPKAGKSAKVCSFVCVCLCLSVFFCLVVSVSWKACA